MNSILVVGARFAGAVHAHVLAEARFSVHVIDRRNHVGGNVFDDIDENGIGVHACGRQLFHSKIRR